MRKAGAGEVSAAKNGTQAAAQGGARRQRAAALQPDGSEPPAAPGSPPSPAPIEGVVQAGGVHALKGKAVELHAQGGGALLVVVDVEDWGGRGEERAGQEVSGREERLSTR